MVSDPESVDSTATSPSLLQRAHAHDPGAWDRLLFLYAPLVKHWCRKMALPEQEIADVVQEVFQAVAIHLGDLHLDRPGDTFRGWLRAITRNKVHDLYRRRQREPQAAGGTEAHAWWARVPDLAQAGVEGADPPEVNRALFRRALELIQDSFEEKTWQAFWLVVVEGRSPQDVAHELGMTPGTVRVAKCRVLHRLRQELGDLHS